MLTIETPAASRGFLSYSELRNAVGVAYGEYDVLLAELGLRAAAMLARACNVAQAGIGEPTLWEEQVKQSFRLTASVPVLILARRFVKTIDAVTVDGTALAEADSEIDRASGLLSRIENGRVVAWSPALVSITYTAGFSTVPADLKAAAARLVAALFAESRRDPLLKRERVEGVGETEFWSGTRDQSALPVGVHDLLAPYASPAGF